MWLGYVITLNVYCLMWLLIHALISTLKLWYGWVMTFHPLCCNAVIHYHNSVWVQFICVSKIGLLNWTLSMTSFIHCKLWMHYFLYFFWRYRSVLYNVCQMRGFLWWWSMLSKWYCEHAITIPNWFYRVPWWILVLENTPDCVQAYALLD